MVAVICMLAAVVAQEPANALPPWLEVNQPTLEKMYGRGVDDAGRLGKPGVMDDKMRRSIALIDPNPLRGEAESYVWLVDPYVQAYDIGWKARRSDWSADQIRTAHDQLVAWAAHGRKRLTFRYIVNSMRPSPPGPLRHPATPDIFRDVQVELKVAGRRYRAVRDPGDLVYFAGHGSIETPGDKIIPHPLAGIDIGPGEISTGGATVTNYFTVNRTLQYDFYQGNFTVEFDLYDPDGKPRVTAKDIGISPILITSGGFEHQAVYTWEDLMNIRAG